MEIIAKYGVDGLARGETVAEISGTVNASLLAAQTAGTAVDWLCPKCERPSEGLYRETIPAQQGNLELDVLIVKPCDHRILVLS